MAEVPIDQRVAEVLVNQVEIGRIGWVGSSDRHLQLMLLAHQAPGPLHHHRSQGVDVDDRIDQTMTNRPVPGRPGQNSGLRPGFG